MPAIISRVALDVPGQTKIKFARMQRDLLVQVDPVVANVRALPQRRHPVLVNAAELKIPSLANRLRHNAERRVLRV